MKATFFQLSAVLLLTCSSSTLALGDSKPLTSLSCESAEGCFLAARTTSDATGASDQVRLKIDRLQVVQERYPGSMWAKRAGLLIGLLLKEREPAEAVRFLRTAQRDWPLLDDYLRFWIGESLLKAGDASQAASVLASIAEAIPDTLLIPRALFRSGEAWARAGQCQKGIDLLTRGVALAPQEPVVPTALLTLANCYTLENRQTEGVRALKQLWIHYPNSPEARDAAGRLGTTRHGELWPPTPDDVYARGDAFFALALHGEAMEEFNKFLVMAPQHPRTQETRFRIGLARVRLKRYDQAEEAFKSLISAKGKEAGEAAVWLGRVYLRLGVGDRLLALSHSASTLSLSSQQRAAITMMGGTWLEDQGQYDEALDQYHQVAQSGDPAQRSEALWRIGWVHYRTGQYQSALTIFQEVLKGRDDPQFIPQVLYWTARAHERLQDPHAADLYLQLCGQYELTYYCQSARSDVKPTPISALVSSTSAFQHPDGKRDLARERRYLKAFELKLLGMDQDAAKELATLMEQYARDRPTLMELSALLSEAGAHHQALRLARLHFKDGLERGGEEIPSGLWKAAYPTAYLSTIRSHAGAQVDPFLAAAIIREESQYDPRALSRVGAIGLMQVMPATAQAVARKYGFPQVSRDDLFDQEINIRYGVRYLGQLLQQYGGNLIYAVAAYNAGPPAVSAWIAKFGEKEPDEFVELIPYQETRQYVKRVLRSYRQYSRLAGISCVAGSLDKVC